VLLRGKRGQRRFKPLTNAPKSGSPTLTVQLKGTNKAEPSGQLAALLDNLGPTA
jgi:hypothetical protein